MNRVYYTLFRVAIVAVCFALTGVSASAQQDPNDLGPYADTVALVTAVSPSANPQQLNVQVDLYVYSDYVITGASLGWSWDNPNLQMDSAHETAEIAAAFDGATFFFEDGLIATTNANQRFLFGAFKIFSSGLAGDSTGRRLWASYYFTLSNWNASDTILIDTSEFNTSSVFRFARFGSLNYVPRWKGPLIIPDDSDIDGDGILDRADNCPFDYNPSQSDFDSDGIGDVCDPCPMDTLNDQDGDGICGGVDNCIDVFNPNQYDSDGDGNGDPCDRCPGFDDSLDSDSDGVPDSCDVCPGFDDSIDLDLDGVPDGCDICAGFDDLVDTDGDGFPDGCDICPGFDDAADDDGDSVPDSCDICPGFDDFADSDGDGIADSCDNCPTLFNTSQSDIDGDGIGNVCDFCMFDPGNDMDADSICAAVDNCPSDYNPGQEDTDSDGIGDACCCVGLRGDVNGDGLSTPDVVDVTYLIDFLWQGGDTPPCPNGADVNGQDGADIVDVTFLVDFLWQGGPPPPACP